LNQPTTPPGAGRGPYPESEVFQGRYDERDGGGSYCAHVSMRLISRGGGGKTYAESPGAKLCKDDPAHRRSKGEDNDGNDDAAGR
jgi:hypothetical protein